MPDFSRISIIIPAYNEEHGLPKVLESLTNEAELREAEIIVVNDGSTDRTLEVAKSFPAVHTVSNNVNRGYGASIIRGVRTATRDYIVWFDADNQHRVEDLVLVAKTLIEEDLDYCIGARTKTSHEVGTRKLGKKLLLWAVQFAVGEAVEDFNSGLRGFRKAILLKYLSFIPKGFGASTVTTLLMLQRNHHGKTQPILVLPRIGTSSVHQLRDGLRTLLLVLRIYLLFKPLRFFGSIGMVLLITGSIYGLYRAFTERLGFPTLALLIVLMGVHSFFFGFLADQVSASRLDGLE